jgi:type I restriction enzyme, R subunit
MQNPTLVVLTDRNDLDDQLFGQFQRCARHPRPDAGAGREPRASARAAEPGSGGVVFTTIQKFMPERARRCPS